MLKAIVFDFDGVIVDSEPLHYRAFLQIARTLGVEFTYQQYLDKYIGYDDRDAFRVMLEEAGKPAGPELVLQLVERKADAFEAIVSQGIQTYPGVVDFIAAARARMPIAIASGATRRDIDLILGGMKLASCFKPIVSADDVKKSKPDPQCYSLAVEGLAKLHPALGLKPEHCLAIEDTAAGIDAARGAGLLTIGLTTTGTADKLHRAGRVLPRLEGLTIQQLQSWFE